ncbi:hypothetical protein ZWY2020_007604 [Hordeum vulgare]|nr:hypothetical protein ZWY2020_007604 [Hordeum vulgare]
MALAPYRDYWRQTKMLVTTHLLVARKVRFNHVAREHEVWLVLARLGVAAAVLHTSVDVGDFFIHFTNDVVCQVVLGRLPREAGRNQMFRELLEIHSKLLSRFNLPDYFLILARLDMMTSKAVKLKRRWDDLLDGLIDKHVRKMVKNDEEEDFIDVFLSV